MKVRIRFQAPALLLAFTLLPAFALSQLRMTLAAGPFQARQRIDTKIQNLGKSSVTYCVEFGQHSPVGDTVERTPFPFYVERRNRRKWSVLLIGPDIGSARSSVVLKSGDTQEFPFRLGDRGQMRLVLRYWIGEREDACSETKKGMKVARSRVFRVADAR